MVAPNSPLPIPVDTQGSRLSPSSCADAVRKRLAKQGISQNDVNDAIAWSRLPQYSDVQPSQDLHISPEEITSEDSECEYLFVPGTVNTPNDKTKEILDKSYRGEDLIKYENFEDFEAAFFE